MKRWEMIFAALFVVVILAAFYCLGFTHGMTHEALERLEETANRPRAWEEG